MSWSGLLLRFLVNLALGIIYYFTIFLFTFFSAAGFSLGLVLSTQDGCATCSS